MTPEIKLVPCRSCNGTPVISNPRPREIRIECETCKRFIVRRGIGSKQLVQGLAASVWNSRNTAASTALPLPTAKKCCCQCGVETDDGYRVERRSWYCVPCYEQRTRLQTKTEVLKHYNRVIGNSSTAFKQPKPDRKPRKKR